MTHPLASAYLDDIATQLAALPPNQRADVLTGLTEHINQRCAEGATVPAVLAELGSPEQIALAAGMSATSVPESTPPRRVVPVLVVIGALLLIGTGWFPIVGIPLGLVLIVIGVLLLRDRSWPRPLAWAVAACGLATVLVGLFVVVFVVAVDTKVDSESTAVTTISKV